VRSTPATSRDRAARRRLLAGACALATAALGQKALAQLAAFPGAAGFGASATGGRGGSVYVVTNLNDSGAGSFRDAVSQSNRTVVFAVSGYEHITSPISASSNLTILGQTAPGGGFGVYGAEVSFYGKSNDIVQYMRFRDTSQDPGGTSTSNSSGNCVNLGNTNNIIFDHDSLEFASYNNVDASGTTGADNLTFQNSIIANPILSQQFNFHWQGNQGTFINNIFANAHNRSILSKGNVQFVNNTDYNYQSGLTTGDSSGGFSFDLINNYSVAGPSTTSASDAYYQVDSHQIAYATGNLLDSNKNGTLSGSSANTISGATVSATPWSTATAALPTLSATASYAFNLVHSGASLAHDPTTFVSSLGYHQVDQQVINDVASNGTQGRLYNSEKDTGLSNNGLGTITSGTPPTSTANDGIPDSWKLTHGLSTSVADSTLLNPLGYTMIEQYAYQISDLYSSQTWSSASGNWVSNSGNWSSATPGVYDHALIRGNGASNGSVTVSGSNAATAFSVSIGGNGPAAGESLLVSGGTLLAYNFITVGDQNNGTLQLTGGTVTADTVQLGNTVWNSSGNSSTTYTGTLVLSGGTLQAGEVMQGGGSPGNWNTGSAWTWSGGTLQAGPAGLLVGAPATLGAGGGILDTNSVSAQVNGALSGAGGFTVIGGGTATLAASNTYLGPTTITASTLVAPLLTNGGSPSSLGASSNAAANLILDGGTLMGTGSTDRLFTLNASSTLDNSSGMSFTNTGAIALAGGKNLTLTLAGSNTGHNIFSPSLGDGGNGFVTSVVVGGTGKWDFSNGVKSYSGDTDVTGGTLETLSANALSPQSNMVISTGATLDFHAHSQSIDALSGNGSVTDSFGNAETFSVGQAKGSGTFTGTISGAVSLVKNGSGVQVLSGANTYNGSTTISAGTLTIGGAGLLGAGSYAANISNNGTFVFNSTAGQTLSGAISDNGTVTDSGTGRLTLSGNESFTGTLTAGSGSTLVLTGNNTARGTSTTQLNGSGTLQLRANAGNIVNGNSSALSGSATGFGVLSSYPTPQSVAIQLRSDSSVTFTGANGLGGVGNTVMNFDVGNITAGNSSNTLTFAPGGFNVLATTINVTGNSGYSLALGTLTNVGAGNLTLNPTTGNLIVAGIGESANYTAPLIVQGSGNTTIIGAIATGNSTVTKAGTGALTLLGISSYSGLTTISAGTLLANNGPSNGSATGSGNVAVAASTAGVGNSTTWYTGAVLSGNGSVSGTVTLTGSAAPKLGGIITAGTSADSAMLTTGKQTWNSGAAYRWHINAGNGTATNTINGTPGSNYDELVISPTLATGTPLTVSGNATDPFTIAPTGNLTGMTYGSTYNWAIAQIGTGNATTASTTISVGGKTLSGNSTASLINSASSSFALDTSQLTVNSGLSVASSSFSLYFEPVTLNGTTTDDLLLSYDATPEPAATLLVFAGAVPMLMGRRRRKNRDRNGEGRAAAGLGLLGGPFSPRLCYRYYGRRPH
jgi:autotransporter-associated beta strand protein